MGRLRQSGRKAAAEAQLAQAGGTGRCRHHPSGSAEGGGLAAAGRRLRKNQLRRFAGGPIYGDGSPGSGFGSGSGGNGA
ncbi:hypothetical protein SDC9_208833 [bioreactor metagenome]|uniref:Uncharacterized protein n=1 Tax=bioreactor metagenome TaxID=1076179 RepID=A0A645JEL0_9ZZZZ